MLKVYKYNFQAANEIDLELPDGAQILHVDQQSSYSHSLVSDFLPSNELQLWALVDPETHSLVNRRIRMAGTGHTIEQSPSNLKFINTVIIAGGSLVFHFFEVI